ncbi:MAG TPA: hypothetical protein VGG46_13285 [Terriglobales bacterium]|jgi:hypothetical protein
MPIARIITSMPEFSGGLVRDLNSRGFEVHIISPEQAVSGTADLEIKLEAMSRPAGANVRATEIPVSTSFSVPESAGAAVQQPALPPQQEDIWTMLAAFEGDAETQEAIATTLALNEDSAQPNEPAQDAPSVTHGMAEPVKREQVHPSYSVDPDLVPSMFNFSSSGENAPAEQEMAPLSNRSPWHGSELRKTNLHSWNSPLPKVAAAAAGCAAFVILMFLTFAHSHALPKAADSPAPGTRMATPLHVAEHSAGPGGETAVPIKSAVLVSTVNSPSKATPHASEADTAVAEDTIVRYGSAKKTPAASATKPSTIRYYSDMD